MSADGRVVLVTRGTGGIGKASAVALARMGARVVITSHAGRLQPFGVGEIRVVKQVAFCSGTG